MLAMCRAFCRRLQQVARGVCTGQWRTGSRSRAATASIVLHTHSRVVLRVGRSVDAVLAENQRGELAQVCGGRRHPDDQDPSARLAPSTFSRHHPAAARLPNAAMVWSASQALQLNKLQRRLNAIILGVRPFHFDDLAAFMRQRGRETAAVRWRVEPAPCLARAPLVRPRLASRASALGPEAPRHADARLADSPSTAAWWRRLGGHARAGLRASTLGRRTCCSPNRP